MLDDFLKEVVSIVVGKNSEQISELLNSKKHVNEFLIAKKLDITINQTRNILYKLSDFGLVSSIRKKDKKKGWYTYFWKIEILKALEFLKEEKNKRLGHIYNQIKNRESKEFYICERCNIEVNEENALLHDFTCNECGEIFARKDNTKVLKELKRYAEKIESELALIQQELDKENEKLGKIREKEIKKEKAEKAAKRAEKRKKTSKKKPKKKAKTKKALAKRKKVKKKIKKILKTVKKAVKKKASKSKQSSARKKKKRI